MGRPGHLTVKEEAEVAQLIKALRLDGVAINYDVICRISREIAAERRGVPVADVPPLSRSWAKGYKMRHSLSKLRVASTDRPTNTPAEVDADNAWRCEVQDIIQHPADYGVGVDTQSLPAHCIYGLDETPLLYAPKVKTYASVGERRIVIHGSSEKRSLIATPTQVWTFTRLSEKVALHCL